MMKLTRRSAMKLAGGGLLGMLRAAAPARGAASPVTTANVRRPARAGSFYPAEPAECRKLAKQFLAAAKLPADLPKRIRGGIVPHAGWVFSGQLAALTLKALAAAKPTTLVIFGADHYGMARRGEVYDAGAWRTPLGNVAVDADLARALIAAGDCLQSNSRYHRHEHSIEVQMPLIRLILPKAKIVPITVPPEEIAVKIGQAVGKVLAAKCPSQPWSAAPT